MGIHPTFPFALGFISVLAQSDGLCWKLVFVLPVGKASVHPWQARRRPSEAVPCVGDGCWSAGSRVVQRPPHPVRASAERGGHLHPVGSASHLSSLSRADLYPASKDLRWSPGKREQTSFWDATGRSAKATHV